MAILTRAINAWKRHGLYTVVVVVTPVLLVGGYLWVTGEFRSGFGTTSPAPPPPRPRLEPVPVLPIDLEERLLLVRSDVERLRSRNNPPAAALGAALLRLGDLERAVGDPQAGAAALHEALALDQNSSTWIAREAATRLADVDTLAGGPTADREQWRTAFRRQRQAEALHAAGRFRDGIAAAEEALKLRRSLWRGSAPTNSTKFSPSSAVS